MPEHDNLGRPTDHSPEAIRARYEVASQHVADLCSGRERWTMRIPVQPGRDSDLVISNALDDIPRLLDRLADAATPPSPDSSLPAGWQAPEDFDG